jgi:uncharacterized membrane protein (UPF0182 family)
VKAVIDGYDGDVTFYLHNPEDPIAKSWASVYPGLFQDASTMPEGLDEHLRYPQDLFRLQSQVYLEYHVTDVNQLFSGNDAWSFPGDPSTITRTGIDSLRGDSRDLANGTVSPLAQTLPYYLLTKLPGEEDLSYLLLQPFNPLAKRNMVGFLVADSTPGRYGRLVDFRMPQGELVDGTEQVGQRIEQDADISEQLSLWRGDGSRVIKGDLLVVPIEESVIYFQPIYLEEEGGAFPEFRRVAVVFSDKVRWADSLDGALELVFGPSEEGQDPAEPPTDGDATIEDLITEANTAFDNASAALRQGDLAGYQRWVDEAQRLVNEIADLVNQGTDASILHIS